MIPTIVIALGLVGLVLILVSGVSTDVSGFNGAVTMVGHGGSPFAFAFSVVQRKKDVGRYGGSRFNKKRGGILDVSGSISVFLQHGASTTSVAVGISTLDKDGAALVLTAETGCTWTGTGILDFNTTHRFDDPAVEGTYPFDGTGDWVEAWS